MRTARSSMYRRGISAQGVSDRDPPPVQWRALAKDTQNRYPLDRDPPEGIWGQPATQEVTSYRDPPVNRQTPVKTLSQISFAGGKNSNVNIIWFESLETDAV